MFALAVNVLLILLAVASLAVVADCALRWWSAFGALKRQLADGGTNHRHSPSAALRRGGDKSRALVTRKLTPRVAQRAAA